MNGLRGGVNTADLSCGHPQGICGPTQNRLRVIIPTAHNADGPLFRQPIIPTAHWSDHKHIYTYILVYNIVALLINNTIFMLIHTCK